MERVDKILKTQTTLERTDAEHISEMKEELGSGNISFSYGTHEVLTTSA